MPGRGDRAEAPGRSASVCRRGRRSEGRSGAIKGKSLVWLLAGCGWGRDKDMTQSLPTGPEIFALQEEAGQRGEGFHCYSGLEGLLVGGGGKGEGSKCQR